MLIEISPEFVRQLLRGAAAHPKIALARAASDAVLLHAEGKGAAAMLAAYRPSQPEWIRKHVEANYRQLTQAPLSKIFNSLGKINRSDNFTIIFRETDALSKQVSDYTEKDYPQYDSIRNWFFTEALAFLLTEPNGWLVVQPRQWTWDEMAAPQPVATLYRAEQAVHWEDNNFVFLLLDEKSRLPRDRGEAKTGSVYLLVTRNEIVRYEQERDSKTENNSFGEFVLYRHNINELPAFRMGGPGLRQKDRDIYKSFIAGVLPDLDEALVQMVDLQASIKQHIYPEAAVYGANPCHACRGEGRVREAGLRNNTEYAICNKCAGAGRVVSPFADIIVRENKDNEHPMPAWAPKKYITKDIAPVQFLDEQIDKHIFNAYAAINFEFLAQPQLNQSGRAKELDRDELNSFVYNIASHIVSNILKPLYWYTFRLLAPLRPPETITQLQPNISLPRTFDIVTAEVYLTELEKAKAAHADSRIVGALEMRFAEKQFQHDDNVLSLLRLTFDLDPLYGKTEDDKLTMRATGGISNATYIISCNALEFTKRALAEVSGFARLPRAAQLAKFKVYATEIDPSISLLAGLPATVAEIQALQVSYFAGNVPFHAAHALLTILFQLPSAEADALLAGSAGTLEVGAPRLGDPASAPTVLGS